MGTMSLVVEALERIIAVSSCRLERPKLLPCEKPQKAPTQAAAEVQTKATLAGLDPPLKNFICFRYERFFSNINFVPVKVNEDRAKSTFPTLGV